MLIIPLVNVALDTMVCVEQHSYVIRQSVGAELSLLRDGTWIRTVASAHCAKITPLFVHSIGALRFYGPKCLCAQHCTLCKALCRIVASTLSFVLCRLLVLL